MEACEYHTMRSVEDTYWWYLGLHALVTNEVAGLLPGNRPWRALDAGCGTGGTMSFLHERLSSLKLFAVDANAVAIEFAKERAAGPVARGSVNELPFADEVFDLVISTDVLYMDGVDDEKALEEFHRVLQPGGCLLLNLPAFEFLRGEHDLAVHTSRRYSKRRVRTLLERTDFGVEKLRYWNTALFPIIAIWRPLSRLLARSREPKSDLRVLPHPVNSLLTSLIRAEVRLTPCFSWPFGSSVFAIARKKAVSHH